MIGLIAMNLSSREQIIFNKEIISSFGCLKMKVAGTDKTAKDT